MSTGRGYSAGALSKLIFRCLIPHTCHIQIINGELVGIQVAPAMCHCPVESLSEPNGGVIAYSDVTPYNSLQMRGCR